MTISIIIPTLGRYDYLKDVLEDLAVQTRPPDEVLVVDQTPPAERVPQFYQRFNDKLPLRVLTLTTTRGTCVSRNLAASLARSDYLLFFDDDLRVPVDLLENYEAVANQGYDVVHGGVRHRYHPLYKQRLAFADPVQQLIASPNTDKIGGTIGVAAGNGFVRREWVERIGGFDLQFDNGMCDDWDFGLKLFREGARMIYHPAPAVQHLKAPSGGRRNYFLAREWGWWVGSFTSYQPQLMAPLLYFYARYFSRVTVRRLLILKVLEIFSFEYRLLRYPWGPFIALVWLFTGITKARAMIRKGPVTLGMYRQPEFEEWTSSAWVQRTSTANV